MATSVTKRIKDNVFEGIIGELENDATSWNIEIVTDVTTTSTSVTTKMTYVSPVIEVDMTGGNVTLPVTGGETVQKVRLIYNDGTDTIMHEETVNEPYTYDGDYIVTQYKITLVTL